MSNRFIDTLETLAKSENLHQGNIDVVAREILSCSAEVLGCERVNAWLFNHYGNELNCLQCYTQSKNSFKSDESLTKTDYPRYFEFLKRNEIIIANNALEEPLNAELIDSYIKPLNITAMVDIPLRSEGKIIGVICFEHCGYLHDWMDDEVKFMRSCGQLLSMALETKAKLETQKELEKALAEKDEVLQLFFERIDNNVQNLISLINFQKYKCKDDYHMNLMEEIKSKLFVMTLLQDKLQASKTPKRVDVAPFISDLVSSVNVMYGQKRPVDISLDLESTTVAVPKAIPLGLIIHELLTNTFKTAFGIDNRFPELYLGCKSENDREVIISIRDNGHTTIEKRDLDVTIDIVEGLVDQIEGQIGYHFDEGLGVEIKFSPQQPK